MRWVHVLLLAVWLATPSCALDFKRTGQHPSTETNTSEVTQVSKIYARHLEECDVDADCLDPVQRCLVFAWAFHVKTCACPEELRNYFDGTCHRINECRLRSHCPHESTVYCLLGFNSNLGTCQCSFGIMRNDGSCPPDPDSQDFTKKDIYNATKASLSSEDDDDHDKVHDDDESMSTTQKLILVLTSVAAVIAIILFFACWRLARVNNNNRNNGAVTQSARQSSPSARRFLSTQSSQTVSHPGRYPARLTASSSAAQNWLTTPRVDPRTVQDPPPSYEELFGSSVSPSGPAEVHRVDAQSVANRNRTVNTARERSNYFY